MSFHRQRSALACSYCRHKKRKCDAVRPQCGNCETSNVDCHYDDTPSQRIDTSGGTKEILSRLKDIRAVLDEQSHQLSSYAPRDSETTLGMSNHRNSAAQASDVATPNGGYSPLAVDGGAAWGLSSHGNRAAQDEPMNIPPQHKTSTSYLLGLPRMKALIGEYPPNLFFLIESHNPLPPELSLDQGPWTTPTLPPFHPDQTLLDPLVSSFINTVHTSYPILHQLDIDEIYYGFLSKGADASVNSALCMVIFALGAVSMSSAGQLGPQNCPPGTEFMKYALPTLMSRSLWSFSYDPVLAQALVLAGVYFAYIVRPLHSWRLIYSATTLLQFQLFNPQVQDQACAAEEVILRLFWSCFLTECDRLAELELPRSSLQQLADRLDLPRCDNVDDAHSTAFLGEVSIRRLLNRIHNSLYPRKQKPQRSGNGTSGLMVPEEMLSAEELSSVAVICEELRRQLDAWHAAIPEPFRPSIGLERLEDDRIAILRIRYFAARHIIYRPFVLHVASQEEPQGLAIPSDVIHKATLCIESCRLYLYHISHILRKPSQYTWTFSISSLGAVVILTLSWLSKDLRQFVSDIDQLQSLAIENIQNWAAVSSLSEVLSIMEEIRRKTRLRLHV